MSGSDNAAAVSDAPWKILAEALDAVADVALDIDAVLAVIARHAAEAIGDVALITLLSEDGQWVRPATVWTPDAQLARDYYADLSSVPGRVGEGRAGQVIATNTPILVPEVDPQAMIDSTRPEWQDVARRLNVHSLMLVPMRVDGKPIGSFSMVRSRPGHPYNERDQALLQSVADRGGLAVVNARAHAKLKEQLATRERDAGERELLQRLFDAMPELGWTARPDGSVDHYNQRWYDYTGRTHEEMDDPTTGSQIVHDPALRPVVVERWREALTSGNPFEMELRLRRHDGEYRWFLTRAQPMRDASGSIVRWVGTSTDIDDQKRLEDRLAAAHDEIRGERNRFRSLLDHLPVSISFLIGDDLTVEYAHPRTVQSVGREIEGKPLVEAIPELREHPSVRRIRKVMATGEIDEQRDVMIPGDRLNNGVVENTYWSSIYQPIRRLDGSIEGVMTFDQEVTHSSDVEQRFRMLVESVKDYAIFMLDRDGCVATWNAGAARINGYEAQEIVGKHLSVFYPPEDVAAGKCDREIEGALRDGRFEDEGWRLRKDGTRLWANATLTPLRNRTGEIVGFAKVTRDLTERKEAEVKLQRLAADKAAFEEKARIQEFQERFLAILGHDLRNPLAAIDMGAALLQQRANRANDVAQIRTLDRMRSSTRRMLRMLEQILDLTRSRLSGGLEVRPAPMDLLAMMTAVVEELRMAHPTRTIDLRCPSISATWDRDRLEQVFSNVIGNAVNYGLPDTAVRVECSEGSDMVEVLVHNDGPPIPPGLLEQIFNPFRRGLRDSRKPTTAGLGLGLYISQQIIAAHGGEIEVRSTEIDGTTFLITLPLSFTRPPTSPTLAKSP